MSTIAFLNRKIHQLIAKLLATKVDGNVDVTNFETKAVWGNIPTQLSGLDV